MTGHHRLQEQITPPHKHLFVFDFTFVFTLPLLALILSRLLMFLNAPPTYRKLESSLQEEPGKFCSTKQPTHYSGQYANNN